MRFTTSLRLATVVSLALAPALAHSPHDVVTELAVSPSYAIDHTLFASLSLTDNNLFALSNDSGRSWRYIGTPMASSPPRSFAFSPAFLTDRTAFAASTSTGMWRTLDGGISWKTDNLGLPGAARDVAVSPYFENDHMVLAATDSGVYVSTDGGDSWQPSNAGLTEQHVLRVGLVADGQGGLTAFAVGFVFHLSLDGGAHWTAKGSFSKKVESLSVSPNFPVDQRVACAFGRLGLGVALSQDGGQTFQFMNDGLSDPFVEEVALANDGTLFAATDTEGCFRSDGPGSPWVLKDKGFEVLSDLTLVHNTEVVPSPDFANDGTVFEGAYEGMYRSYDRGDDWWQLNVYTQLLQRRFVFAPQFATERTLLAGDYGGAVFRYHEQAPAPQAGTAGASGTWTAPAPGAGPAGGAVGGFKDPAGPPVPPFTWDAPNAGLTSPWSSVLSASPGGLGARTLLYGYVGLFQSSDEGQTWTTANKPAPVSVVRAIGFSPDFASDQTVFIGSGTEGSYRSTNGCQKWLSLDGLPPTLATIAIAVSPGWSQDRTVYYASRNFGIWRSTDGGWQWEQLTNGLPTTNIKALVLSPDFVVDGFMLAGTYADGIWASYDRGESWSEADRGLYNTFSHIVESLAFSPDFVHDRTVFVALQNEGVWRSTDGAANWMPTGPELPAPPAEIAVSPTFAIDHTLVAGTFGGTVISRNAGDSWEPLPGFVRADDGHPAVQYSGTWTTVSSSSAFISTLATTATLGDGCALEFYGRKVTWYCDQKFDGAVVEVSVDAGTPAAVETSIDTSSHVPHAQAPLFAHDFGVPGWHVIRVEHAGPAGLMRTLRSDGFAYEW
jgi:photosystem II stability/assembly factor-like uncharacterized protein